MLRVVRVRAVERRKLDSARRFDNWLGLTVQVKGAVDAVADTKLLARCSHNAIFAVADEDRLAT